MMKKRAIFKFTGNTKLQILNVTGYEIWEIRYPNGAVEYSQLCEVMNFCIPGKRSYRKLH